MRDFELQLEEITTTELQLLFVKYPAHPKNIPGLNNFHVEFSSGKLKRVLMFWGRHV